MTLEDIQMEAEKAVRLQLGFTWGYKIFPVANPRPLDPQILVQNYDGSYHDIYVCGFIPPERPSTVAWEAARRAFASEEDFKPFFLEVELTPQGSGNHVIIHGLDVLRTHLHEAKL